MKLVADANILIAVCITHGTTANIFFRDNLTIYIPEYVWEEIHKHLETIQMKTHREGITEILSYIQNKVIQVPEKSLRPRIIEAMACTPDPEDVQYFALALKLRLPLW